MRSQRSYQREIKALRDMLVDVEWVHQLYNGGPECPYCAKYQEDGHAKDCRLSALIEKRKGKP